MNEQQIKTLSKVVFNALRAPGAGVQINLHPGTPEQEKSVADALTEAGFDVDTELHPDRTVRWRRFTTPGADPVVLFQNQADRWRRMALPASNA